MNRRGFLRFLLTAPLVAPIALKALALAEPVIRFVSPATSANVNRWASKIWVELPREIYFSRFMRDNGIIQEITIDGGQRGNSITFTRIRKLDQPK